MVPTCKADNKNVQIFSLYDFNRNVFFFSLLRIRAGKKSRENEPPRYLRVREKKRDETDAWIILLKDFVSPVDFLVVLNFCTRRRYSVDFRVVIE